VSVSGCLTRRVQLNAEPARCYMLHSLLTRRPLCSSETPSNYKYIHIYINCTSDELQPMRWRQYWLYQPVLLSYLYMAAPSINRIIRLTYHVVMTVYWALCEVGTEFMNMVLFSCTYRSQWPRYHLLLGLRVRIPLGIWMSVVIVAFC